MLQHATASALVREWQQPPSARSRLVGRNDHQSSPPFAPLGRILLIGILSFANRLGLRMVLRNKLQASPHALVSFVLPDTVPHAEDSSLPDVLLVRMPAAAARMIRTIGKLLLQNELFRIAIDHQWPFVGRADDDAYFSPHTIALQLRAVLAITRSRVAVDSNASEYISYGWHHRWYMWHAASMQATCWDRSWWRWANAMRWWRGKERRAHGWAADPSKHEPQNETDPCLRRGVDGPFPFAAGFLVAYSFPLMRLLLPDLHRAARFAAGERYDMPLVDAHSGTVLPASSRRHPSRLIFKEEVLSAYLVYSKLRDVRLTLVDVPASEFSGIGGMRKQRPPSSAHLYHQVKCVGRLEWLLNRSKLYTHRWQRETALTCRPLGEVVLSQARRYSASRALPPLEHCCKHWQRCEPATPAGAKSSRGRRAPPAHAPVHANHLAHSGATRSNSFGRRLRGLSAREQAHAVRLLGTVNVSTLSADIQAAVGQRCALSTWSRDGFGHQLAAALSCEALAMANKSYAYVRSNHTAFEHHPSNASTLLAWLNRFGSGTGLQKQPLSVPEARYHSNCLPSRVPPCSPGVITVCDSCFGFVSPELAERSHIRQRLAAKLRRSVAATLENGEGCPSRRVHICIHLRGAGSPGVRTTRLITSLFAEREAARQRLKRFPAPWWRRALEVAAKAIQDPGRTAVIPQAPLRVVVHTNSRGLAASIFANVSTLDDGTHVQIRTSDENTPLLEMLHELIFCCDSLITSESSISWVAALATKAVVVSPSATEPHIGFKLHGVTVT